ncbi:unnamed protein product, partial [Polarella glacialis]
ADLPLCEAPRDPCPGASDEVLADCAADEGPVSLETIAAGLRAEAARRATAYVAAVGAEDAAWAAAEATWAATDEEVHEGPPEADPQDAEDPMLDAPGLDVRGPKRRGRRSVSPVPLPARMASGAAVLCSPRVAPGLAQSLTASARRRTGAGASGGRCDGPRSNWSPRNGGIRMTSGSPSSRLRA